MKKILVIDNDNNAQCEIIELLNNDETQITYAKSVREALKIFITGDYALVILDAGLSECDGYRLLEVMQAVKPTPILVLSAKNGQHYTSEKYNVPPISNDSREYCLYDSLTLAKKAVCSCKSCEEKEHYYTLVCGQNLIITPARREVLLKGEVLNLTKKEFDLLFCLASHPEQVLSREQIYRQVWSDEIPVNIDEVVKAHIKSLRKKLAPADVEYIQNVWGVGYRFQPDGDSE